MADTLTPEIRAALETIRTADAQTIGYMAGLLKSQVQAGSVEKILNNAREGKPVLPLEVLSTIDSYQSMLKLFTACQLALNGHDGAALIALRDFVDLQDAAYVRRFA